MLPSAPRRPTALRLLAAMMAIGALLFTAAGHQVPAAAATPSLGALNGQLGQEQARQQHLSSSMASLSGLIGSLDGQIALVQSREVAVRQALANDRAQLAKVAAELRREQARLRVLRARLARARMLLSGQLRSSYEGDRPDLVSVVLTAHGFKDLLEQITFLGRAEHQQQTMIAVTRAAKAQAAAAAAQLTATQVRDRQMTQAAATRAQALQGMNALLAAKQGALSRARSAQQASLQASRDRATGLRSRIA
ncbi:MAG: hypothetical protein M3016_07460, partial [Actinomycetota bacterium]|nr:hypothetical protein [Actinomycetota bacterium]